MSLIQSAEEFVQLRTSGDPLDNDRATRDAATEEVWREIVRDYPAMREWVAHNKTAPPAVLRVLAEDTDPKVRMTVAMVRRAGDSALRLLAADADSSVRRAVAFNAKAPVDVLEILAQDSCEHVAAPARTRLRGDATKK
jgi:hypothetical protein